MTPKRIHFNGVLSPLKTGMSVLSIDRIIYILWAYGRACAFLYHVINEAENSVCQYSLSASPSIHHFPFACEVMVSASKCAHHHCQRRLLFFDTKQIKYSVFYDIIFFGRIPFVEKKGSTNVCVCVFYHFETCILHKHNVDAIWNTFGHVLTQYFD